MVSRTVPGSPGEECGLGVRWGRALTSWVPGLESVDQYGAGLGGSCSSRQVWAGTSNNNRGPRSAWRRTQPVAGQRRTMWSASLIHLTLCALFAFGFEGLITFPHSYSAGASG